MNSKRIEHDSMGEVEVRSSALYGAQTQRAVNNFTISSQPMPQLFIEALLHIKRAAADANGALGLLSADHATAIISACDTLLDDLPYGEFPVPVFQTGSGTSSNMNVNEVICGVAHNAGYTLHPNDHVNLGQSSNDVIPSALQIGTALSLTNSLIPELQNLASQIRAISREHRHVIKTGRTHLMDALPIRIYEEFTAWAVQLEECVERFQDGGKRLSRLPLGGTAVGSGVNCHPDFAPMVLKNLSTTLSIEFTSPASLYKGLSSLDTPLEISGLLKTAGMAIFKIANDLRWMNSGPGAGLGEITLPSLQPGSSIMPAKVNPVIQEAVCMAVAQVAGFDTTNTIACQAGNFQLNTMFPVVAANLLNGVELLSGSCQVLGEKCFAEIVINEERCSTPLHRNPILVTALVPHIGYEMAAEIGKRASMEQCTVLEIALEVTDIDKEQLLKLLDPANLADGGSA